jgi:hypothetical protein
VDMETGPASGSGSSTTVSVKSRDGWKSGSAAAATTVASATVAVTTVRRLGSGLFGSIQAVRPVWPGARPAGASPVSRPVDDCRRAGLRFQCSNRCSIATGSGPSRVRAGAVTASGRPLCGVAAASGTGGPGGPGAVVELDPHLAPTHRAADNRAKFVYRRR